MEGETGVLLMTGPQLTPGYWRDPERTARAYVRPPGEARIFYRTGDRVRRGSAGAPMVYLGRLDNQIKVQGYRVELGEIEAAIVTHPDVAQAAVAVHDDPATGRRLVAYVAPQAARSASIGGRSRRELPDEAFIPTRLVLDDAAFDALAERLADAPEPAERLVELMRG